MAGVSIGLGCSAEMLTVLRIFESKGKTVEHVSSYSSAMNRNIMGRIRMSISEASEEISAFAWSYVRS